MKIQNILRTPAIAIGLGAALLLAGSARSQEIENTSFDDGPNCVAFTQPAPAPVAEDSATTQQFNSVGPVATIATPVVANGAVASLLNSVEGGLLATALVFIALVAVYALAEAKRANRNLDARTRAHVSRRMALS